MHIALKGYKAIVTGSTAGIGRAAAEGLARAGASVVINGRGQARVDDAVREMRQAFPEREIAGVAADLSTMAGVEAITAPRPRRTASRRSRPSSDSWPRCVQARWSGASRPRKRWRI